MEDVIPRMIWTVFFVKTQRFDPDTILIHPDTRSPIGLKVNGKTLSEQRTRHLNIYFLRDVLKLNVSPLEDTVADYNTKPLQGIRLGVWTKISWTAA